MQKYEVTFTLVIPITVANEQMAVARATAVALTTVDFLTDVAVSRVDGVLEQARLDDRPDLVEPLSEAIQVTPEVHAPSPFRPVSV